MVSWSDWRMLNRRGRLKLVAGLLAPLYLVLVVALAFWPASGKYPLGVPIVVGLTALVALWRNRLCCDDIGAALAIVLGIGVLAAWTVFAWRPGTSAGFALFALIFGFPVVWIWLAAIGAGSADLFVWYKDGDRADR
jgi:hypothetical protein